MPVAEIARSQTQLYGKATVILRFSPQKGKEQLRATLLRPTTPIVMAQYLINIKPILL